ncbi:SDR family NAD(P)-dependent oxidoreductase [Amycolatopsis benzoatilytica]|uniref:SDR family NAD(P)-dependent oxidoreductase n=1 Tax=Amycolatopsis benzoatilytica TaxID=346045 RepID=UPI00035DB800|nr:SDR family oxidoreductase [Amycolatopsis benzoatilytica]
MNVLVTGASRGIGRAIAVAFATRGDRIAVHCGSDREAARETLEALPGAGHVLVSGDLGNPEAAQWIADVAEEKLGGVDVLVNNAAVGTTPETRTPIAEVSYEQWLAAWRHTLDVNLLGAANVSFHVARHLIARGAPGRIVNIGSRGAFRGEPEYPAYGASKAALHALGQSLAVELAPHGISVTSVAPGFTATERVAGRVTDEVRRQSPFGRVAEPEEIAEAVVFLASSETPWASGSILDLNGASYLR